MNTPPLSLLVLIPQRTGAGKGRRERRAVGATIVILWTWDHAVYLTNTISLHFHGNPELLSPFPEETTGWEHSLTPKSSKPHQYADFWA
jgi:hypothetical protein